MVEDDEWKKSALRDAAVVARLLFSMEHVRLYDVLKATSSLRWARKKLRSIPLSPPPSPRLGRCCDVVVSKKVDRTEQHGSRCSPTSPFSFNGYCDASPPSGFEASSLPPLPSSRSKVEVSSAIPENIQATGTNEATTAASGKKSRKKKTFAELQEEENLLLKERMQLRHELDALRSRLEEERTLNQKLKRIKVDTNVERVTTVACDQLEDSARTNHDPLVSSTNPTLDDIPQLIPCKVENNVAKKQKNVFLFDLNTMPTE